MNHKKRKDVITEEGLMEVGYKLYPRKMVAEKGFCLTGVMKWLRDLLTKIMSDG
jgi:hypothetical protein